MYMITPIKHVLLLLLLAAGKAKPPLPAKSGF